MSNPTEQTASPDLDALWRQWRDVSVENFAWMTGQAASGEAFTKSSKAMMDLYLSQAAKARELMGQSLDAMEIPRRSDLARLSTQVLGVEKRVLDVEEHLDRLESRLAKMNALLEGLQPSLKTVGDLDARLDRLEEMLRQLPQGAPAAVDQDRPEGGATKTQRRK